MGSRFLRHQHLWAGTAMVMALGITSTAYAQEATTDDQSTELKPIVLTTEKGGRVADSPQTQTTERAKIQERMVTDFKDFARRIDAGVNFNSNTKSVNIRGLQDQRVLTTIDGIRLPWLTDPRDSAQGGVNSFDFDSLSSVDITKGADSSRYGSGTLGGVVELRTLNPEDLIEEGKNFGALTKTTYDSADQSAGGNAAIAGRFNDSWLLVQGGYKKGHETENQGHIGGYGTTRTEANPADFVQKNLLVKFHQYLEGGHRFGLTADLFNRDEDFDNMRGTTSSYEQGGFKSGEEVDRKRFSGSYDFISPDGTDIVDQASVNIYWQKEKLNNTTDAIRLIDPRAFAPGGAGWHYGPPYGVYKRDNMIEQTSYGITGNAEKELEIGGVAHEFRFGGELYWQKTHQYSSGVDNCPDVDWTTVPQPYGPQSCRLLHSNASDMPDVDSVVFGAFVEDDIKLMDNRLTITPGVRFDWYSHDPKSTAAFERSPNYDPSYLNSNDDFGISPKLRFAWQATPELELFAQYARGFRAPTVTELYQNYGAPGSYARIGNPDLETETSNGFEIGAKYAGTDYSVSATVFNNYYRNFIDTVTIAPPGGEYPIGGITGYDNINKVRIYGIELAGEWRFHPHWRTWGSFAWTNGRDSETGAYLNSVAPLRAIVGLGYAQETWGTDVSLTMAADRDKVSGSGFEAPGYGIVDLSAWWAPEQIGEVDVKGLKVQAGVFNVFDKKYWDAVSVPDGTTIASRDYYSEPGRTFKVSISKKF
ncbi:TonB-dependent hemoglobin/transferrin/lactoferrin family receptor [Neorhizobium petrolearium]|uniref:TonB-dependent hemoglobin/transferrin/lactoferrin family receptor n=1 Tax=Neorhizobium petrolearium TaxID=515361 RepID=A0ABY8MA47_9HYPH|nr:TonB-dependent hemoglobin/transferrin/lactoferrin family receptor [Neorhizobium petrolearium]MCC2610725.1 TonB-dependent hemoglobin/transferrin/lactoferrin family receptor [Neorhizobium petrolearium]WGI70851.1 TonB-dependent hemoglobin/transferrin/lactoferrin family receptor [Neorhizobium petrolearium]